MQRRAELARAIINTPTIMLLDEPFRGLDAMTRGLMQEYLLGLFEEQHVTTLFVTSDLEEAIYLADVLIVLTASPGTVKSVIDIDLPRPRDFKMLATSRFGEIHKEVLRTLYA
jgi:NitT/TauT family transport system ATP-binding protein